ncbi:hypothetical protein DFI02_12032 [Rhizobium sp. PP-F2F-G20b]|nr:hypothetical protein DFI02_12032 [Rhizobium sp. PP-F2F-G20b]
MTRMTYTQANSSNSESEAWRPQQDSNIFREFLSMKVIEQRRVQQFGNRYGANAHAVGFAQKKELVRNLGVRIDAVRLAELDAITEFLGCNKQEFVMELLLSGLEQAKAAAAQGGLKPMLDEAIDRKVAEAGFSVEPSPNEGYWTLHYKGQPLHNERAAEQAQALGATTSQAIETELSHSET